MNASVSFWNCFVQMVELAVPKQFWNRPRCSVNALISRNGSDAWVDGCFQKRAIQLIVFYRSNHCCYN